MKGKRMKKLLLSTLLLLGLSAVAQGHSVSLSVVSSTTTGASYHWYRAACSVAIANGTCPTASEGTFALVGTTTATTFVDSTVTGNTNYSYKTNAFCPAGACATNFAVNQDSVDSNHVGVAVPPDQVAPPGTLTITNVAIRFDPATNKYVLSANWGDPQKSTYVAVFSNLSPYTKLVGQEMTSGTGWYTFGAAFSGPKQATLKFEVCDSSGCSYRNVTVS